MIKMINGTFGLKVGKIVVAKTKADEPFETDAKTEKRLVDMNLAEYVEKQQEENQRNEEDDCEVTEEYLESMNMGQLKKFAARLNIKVKTGMKKEEIIGEIMESAGQDADETEECVNDETAPEFNPEEAVQ